MHLSRAHLPLPPRAPHKHTPCTWAFRAQARLYAPWAAHPGTPGGGVVTSPLWFWPLLDSWMLLLALLDLEPHLGVAGLSSVPSRELSIQPGQVHRESPQQSLPRAMSPAWLCMWSFDTDGRHCVSHSLLSEMCSILRAPTSGGPPTSRHCVVGAEGPTPDLGLLCAQLPWAVGQRVLVLSLSSTA